MKNYKLVVIEGVDSSGKQTQSDILMDNIKSISVDSNNLIYDSRNNCNAIIETATDTLIQGYSITNIPSSVKIIGTNSFNGVLFKEITIPEGVERIENKAFYYSVWNLEKVILPNSINYIDSDAFATIAPVLLEIEPDCLDFGWRYVRDG